MALNCDCPITSLPTLIDQTCPVDFDQIIRLAFTKTKASPDFTATVGEEITNLSAWTALLAASDDTKIQVSPALANFVIPPSEKATLGGNDNSTVDGIEYVVGDNNIPVTFEIHSASQAVISAMDDLLCLSDATLGRSGLTVYMFTRIVRGKAFVLGQAGTVAGDYFGIPVYNFHISTLGSEGFNSKNKYMGSFTVKAEDMRRLAHEAITFDPFALANA